MESVCTGRHDVCLGKVLGVRRDMIHMALHPTLLLPPPPPSVVNTPKRFFSFLNLRSLNHKLQSTQRPIKESIQAPMGLDHRGITEGQGEAGLWFFNDSEKTQEGWADWGR